MSARLDLLRPTLDSYQREFSVLDVGSGINHPSIGYEIGWEYERAVVTQIEKDWAGEVNLPNRTMVLRREVDARELETLAECEHFDVVLAFNVLHWRADWREMLAALTSMGKWLFVQLPLFIETTAPGWEELPTMFDVVERMFGGELIGWTTQFEGHPARPIYRINCMSGDTRLLTRTVMNAEMNSAETLLVIDERRVLSKIRGKDWRLWDQGMNLRNFLMLDGVWPARHRVLELMSQMREGMDAKRRHGDVTVHNIVLNGERAWLVDGFEGWGGDDRENLERAMKEVREWPRCDGSGGDAKAAGG